MGKQLWNNWKSLLQRIYPQTILKYHLNQINRQYEQIVHFGDGKNYFYVARSFGTKDIVFPRKGSRLVSILEKEPISAQVIPWTNGRCYQQNWKYLKRSPFILMIVCTTACHDLNKLPIFQQHKHMRQPLNKKV